MRKFSLAYWPAMALSAYVAATGLCGLTGQVIFSVASTGRFRAQLQVQIQGQLTKDK